MGPDLIWFKSGDKITITSYTKALLLRTAEHPFPSSVKKEKRPIMPLSGKFSTLNQQEKDSPLL
jgi:hypothetical protein